MVWQYRLRSTKCKMSEHAVSPRLFGIPASRADIVAVFRRGPSDWCQVGSWDLGKPKYEPGSWFKGKLFPERCDLSADGQWLAYMAYKGNATDFSESYLAISRLPWLYALAAWSLGDTYARGVHFVNDTRIQRLGEPDMGHVPRSLFGLKRTEPIQFAVERRRGWIEDEISPPLDGRDYWDQRPCGVRMQKRQPNSPRGILLTVEGKYAAFREGSREGHNSWYTKGERGATYVLTDGADFHILDNVQWADWSRLGYLLVATPSGTLQVRKLRGLDDFGILFEANLGSLDPDPQEPPDIARRW
jgi:hypothetical protein